jgi:hypothetical protein
MIQEILKEFDELDGEYHQILNRDQIRWLMLLKELREIKQLLASKG